MKPLHTVALIKGKLWDVAQKTPGMKMTTQSTKTVGRGWFGTSLGAPKETTKTTVPSAATELGPDKPPASKKGFKASPEQLEAARTPKDFSQLSQHAYDIGAKAHDGIGPDVPGQHKAAHDAHYEAAKAWQSIGTDEAINHAVRHIVAANAHREAMKGEPK